MIEGNFNITSITASVKQRLQILKRKQLILILLISLLSLLPLFFLTRILVTTGSDSISNDYLRFTRLADRVLSAGYDWRGYFKDTLDNNVHSYAFLFLFRLALAKLTHLSVMAEIYTAMAITCANLLIFFSILSRFTDSNSKLRLLLLPVLSAFMFSYSQISTYSYGEAALQRAFTHFGILIGLWLLLFRSKSFITPWVMAISGIISAFSGAGGLLAWPVFLFVILITDTRNIKKYIAWFVGSGISSAPYLAFMNFNPVNGLLNPLTLNRIITGLGLPLANNINYGVLDHPQAYLSGLIGLGILLIAVLIHILGRSTYQFKNIMPSLIVIFWGISGAGEISGARVLLAPWYTSEYVIYWLGLVGLCFTMVQPGSISSEVKFLFLRRDKIFQIAGLAGLSVIALLYLQTNLTYTDKSFYLPSRSPSSAACLRNYQTAPTYCESFIFQWGVGNPNYVSEMASVLDKYNWSVLGPHQEWTLQGDYILGTVSLVGNNEPHQIQWVLDGSDEPSFWSDYNRLNLLLDPGQSLLWQIDLPSGLSDAKFLMGVSLPDKTTCQMQSLSIGIETSDGSTNPVFQKNDLCDFTNEVLVTENLLDYAGKRLVIQITNDGKPDGGKAVRLYYPRILIDENRLADPNHFSPVVVKPFNTDLPSAFLPLDAPSTNSLILSTANPEIHDLQVENGTGLMMRNGPVPNVHLTPTQPVCLSNWSRFSFDLALSDTALKRKVGLGLQFRNDQGTSYDVSLDFPLLAGEELHSYWLDLGMFNLPDSFCVTSIQFNSFAGTVYAPGQWIQIENVGFFPRTLLRFGFSN